MSIEPIPLTPEQEELAKLYSNYAAIRRALTQHCSKTVDPSAFVALTEKHAALRRSMQQIANLDPNHFNAANKAVQMAKTALLIPISK